MLLLVDVLDVNCLGYLDDDRIVTGTAGAGIVEWTLSGQMATIETTANYLASNHIVDMVAEGDWPYMLAGKDTEWMITYPSIHPPDGPLYISIPLDQIENASAIEGDSDETIILAEDGSLYRLGPAWWEEAVLPVGIPKDGWTMADISKDYLAISNGSDVVIIDLEDDSYSVILTPDIQDLDIGDDLLAIASENHPDVYNISSGQWLEPRLTSLLDGYGKDWVQVVVGDGGTVDAAASDGSLTRLSDILTEDHLFIPNEEERGWVDGVRDLLPLLTGQLLVATANGTWIVVDGAVSPLNADPVSGPRSNDIRSVRYEADTLWVLTDEGLSYLDFDSRGLPTAWFDGPALGEGVDMDTIDTAYLESVVYICGYGSGIHTYDTFASSAPSRWDRTHLYGDARDTVNDVVVVNGELYTGGPYGIDRMVPGSDPPEFEFIAGSPSGVLCMISSRDQLYIGTEQGLWVYDPQNAIWASPDEVFHGQLNGPINDIVSIGFNYYSAVGDRIQHDTAPIWTSSENVTFNSDVTRLGSRPDVDDPVWATVNGSAFTLTSLELPGPGGSFFVLSAKEQQRERLGDAYVNDLVIASEGTVYLGTDSGLHRIGRYGTSWSEWTTSNGLSANDIRSLSYVASGDLWVGAYGGVDILDVPTGDTTRIGVEDGIPSNLVYDIKMEKQDVWIGTDVGGAAKANRNNLKWSEYNMSTGLIAEDVQALAIWNDHVLFGTDEGVTVLDRGQSTFESYTASSSDLPGNWIWCALSHYTGIYVGTDQGLARFEPDNGKWTAYTTEGIAGVPVRSLEMTISGQLWVGTNEGVHILLKDPDGVPNGTKVQFIDRSNGLPGDEVLALKADLDGMMWVGTSAGVAIVESGHGFPGSRLGVQATFTTHDGLVHDRINAIEEGPEGTIWLGTAGGLSKLTKFSWELQPQWTRTYEDIPDVYLSLDNVVIEPEEPNEGDLVNVSVTVSNPSGKRAIVHVGLFDDEDGEPGDEISTDIAYTEPGGSYEVTLSWTAVGGEQNLWVVADPANLIPESNERNNVVAISIHVNYLPEINDLVVTNIQGIEDYVQQYALVEVLFTYLDKDGDVPDSAAAHVDGFRDPKDLTVVDGDPRDGVLVYGTVWVTLGNTTILIEVSDGIVMVNRSLVVNINFAIEVRGIEKNLGGQEEFHFTVHGLDPWEGDAIERVEYMFVGRGQDPNDANIWHNYPFHSAEKVRDDWVATTMRNSAGKYDLWVVAYDDRSIMALYIEEGMVIKDDTSEVETPWYVWAFGVIIIISLVIVIIYSIRGRSST